MIELIPWMLILFWSHPDEPDKVEARREHHLFASEEDCRMHGENRVAGTEMYHLEHGGAKVSFACMPVPDSTEYEALFEKLDQQNRQEDTEMKNESGATAGAGQ